MKETYTGDCYLLPSDSQLDALDAAEGSRMESEEERAKKRTREEPQTAGKSLVEVNPPVPPAATCQ